jgi:hypothetical protein
MEVLPDDTNQEESTLKPWIDPHQLKQHQGVLLRSVDRSVRLGRWGVVLNVDGGSRQETGLYRSPYNGAKG